MTPPPSDRQKSNEEEMTARGGKKKASAVGKRKCGYKKPRNKDPKKKGGQRKAADKTRSPKSGEKARGNKEDLLPSLATTKESVDNTARLGKKSDKRGPLGKGAKEDGGDDRLGKKLCVSFF